MASFPPKEQPRKCPPLPLPTTVDTTLNFRLVSGGTQVRMAYSKPVAHVQVLDRSLSVPRNLLFRVMAGDKGAAMQL